jgi:DNA-binding ferritin-like protein (Dps family)
MIVIEKIIGDLGEKKRWREIKKRAKALPDDYRTAYDEILKYIWMSSGIGSLDPIAALLELFEESAAAGKKVLDVTGKDVAAFADELVRGEQTYFDKWRDKLNKNLGEKLNGGKK